MDAGTLLPFSSRGGQYPVQLGRLRRPQVGVQVCVFCVRARARKTHKLVEKYTLRRSRNVYGVLPLQSQEAEGFLGIGVMGTR